MAKKREIWIDDIKVIACVLVVLGHFFQSMIKADILPETDLYQWFEQTIYYFHVPLFFVCSGYLYQKFSCVNNLRSWGRNVAKKVVVLGIPYLTFSVVTWLLKTIFSSEVNGKAGGLFETLFLKPIAPYWYLYILFVLFLITPTFNNIRMARIGAGVALAGKVLICMGIGDSVHIVSKTLANGIWFVMGMCLSVTAWNSMKRQFSMALGLIFLACSIAVFGLNINSSWISFALGSMACVAIIELTLEITENRKQSAIFAFFTEYTMPIFLMHTLFASLFRILLLKMGISNEFLHVIGGIGISFVGPIITAKIMQKTKVLEFFLYPGEFIKVKRVRGTGIDEDFND